jgi:hypothetical protein
MSPKFWDLEESILEGDQYVKSDTSVKKIHVLVAWIGSRVF